MGTAKALVCMPGIFRNEGNNESMGMVNFKVANLVISMTATQLHGEYTAWRPP